MMDEKIERMTDKRKCFETAQSIAESIELCTSKHELKKMLKEMGFYRVKLSECTKGLGIEVERGEWRMNLPEKGQAVYIMPFYGVVKAVDYTKKYIDGVAVLPEHASTIMSQLDYDTMGGAGVKLDINKA